MSITNLAHPLWVSSMLILFSTPHLYKYWWCFLWTWWCGKRRPWRNYGHGCLFWSVFNLEFAEQFGAATPWLSLLVAGLVGGIFSIIHAAATVHFRADHVVSGTVLNLMAPALAVFLVKVLYNKGQTDNLSQTFGRFDFPVLAKYPSDWW